MAITTAHYEISGWPREKARWDAFAAERKLLCAWSDRFTLASELYANNTYPYETNPGAVVTNINIEPLRRGEQSQGVSSDMASYEYAVLTVNYSTQTGGYLHGDTLVSEWLETGSEYKQLDYRQIQWGTGSSALALFPSEAPVVNQPTIDYVLVYHDLAVIPAWTTTAVGKVNSNAVAALLLGIVFAPETLLFMGANATRRITTAGAQAFKVKTRFRWKSNGGHGWNYAWNQRANNGVGDWEKMYFTDSSENQVKPYETVTIGLI